MLGYYRINLGYNKDKVSIHNPAEGPYVITLILPEELRDDTGFMVVYYDGETGWITVMETTRSGNELTFVVDKPLDDIGFAILGDHAVNMIGVCIALSVLILAQFIAICVIINRRRHYKKAVRMNGFALPVVALAVRFYPVTVVQAVALQILLVVILQLILILLLAKTDVVPRRRRRHHHAHQSAPEVYATAEQIADASQNDTVENDPVMIEEELPIEELPENYNDGVETSADEESFAEGEAQEAEWYGDEETVEAEDGMEYAESDEEANGYSLEYDAEGNGYTLEYDNEAVEYTDEEFNGEGEGYVEYAEYAEYAEDAEGVIFEAAEDYSDSYEQVEYEQLDYEQLEYDDQAVAYDEEAAPAEDVDYGYDVEQSDDDSQVYYDYAEAQDVLREFSDEATEQ